MTIIISKEAIIPLLSFFISGIALTINVILIVKMHIREKRAKERIREKYKDLYND